MCGNSAMPRSGFITAETKTSGQFYTIKCPAPSGYLWVSDHKGQDMVEICVKPEQIITDRFHSRRVSDRLAIIRKYCPVGQSECTKLYLAYAILFVWLYSAYIWSFQYLHNENWIDNVLSAGSVLDIRRRGQHRLMSFITVYEDSFVICFRFVVIKNFAQWKLKKMKL